MKIMGGGECLGASLESAQNKETLLTSARPPSRTRPLCVFLNEKVKKGLGGRWWLRWREQQ